MRDVLLALLPGVLLQAWLFGPGVLFQCALAIGAALTAEAAALAWRGRPLQPALSDGSAVVTAVLLGVAIPGLAPWWLTVTGALFAILLGKHVYGGLGSNPFNPAMVGYAILLIAFPQEMTRWPAPWALLPEPGNLLEIWRAIFQGLPETRLDAMTMATPLEASRTQAMLSQTLETAQAGFRSGTGSGSWAGVNCGYLLGGLWLLRRGSIDGRILSGVLGGVFAGSLLLYLLDAGRYPTPLFQLFSGASMLGAFFIATDPVTAATTRRGRWLYGLGIGLLTWVIRTWGGYPDGLAFAVLLMNFAAPTLDHFTRPRPYGHPR